MAERIFGATNHFKAKKLWAYTVMGVCILAISLMYAMSNQNTSTLAEYPIMARVTSRDRHKLPHTVEKAVDTTPVESTTPCSFEILQKFINVSAHFPKDGNWSNTQRGNATYQPKICKFEYQMSKDLPPTLMETCATQKGLSKILIFGDSNGSKHQRATVGLLEASGFMCETIKVESLPGMKTPDVTYFTQDTNISLANVVFHNRDCAWCASRKTSCSKRRDRQPLVIEVEYIVMEFMQDSEVTSFRRYRTRQCPPAPARCLVSTTYQQFVFGEYLHNNYPDIILLYGNSHDFRRRSLRQIRVDTTTMLNLIQEYVPKTTKVVWFSRPGENILKKPKAWQRELFVLHSGNLTTNGMIERINNELFSVLQPEITRADTNVLPFFDLEVLIRAVLSWNIDGVHMREEWYQHIVSYVMQTLCNSKLNFRNI